MPDETLALQRLALHERESGDRVCMVQPYPGAAAGNAPVRELSWAQMAGEVRRMASHLKSRDLPPGSSIAILSKNCAHWIMADLAIWMAGHVSVPLYPTLTAGSVRALLAHCDARLLFAGKLDDWPTQRNGVPPGLPCIGFPYGSTPELEGWDDIVARSPPLAGEPMRRGDELATIIYTSGTTGEPKGVMHSFANFAWASTCGVRRIDFGADDRMLSYLPLAHVAERVLVEHGLLHTGARVFFAESLDTFAHDLRRARPTVFFSVPRLWLKFQQGVHARIAPRRLDMLLRLPLVGRLLARKILQGLGLDACRYALGGASPMPLALLTWYARLGLPIVEVYGMSENCAISHATVPGVLRPGTVGQPYDGVEARVDPATGEVQMRSGALMLGYYRADEATRASFTDDGWLRSGDRGELDAEGNLRITGRLKDLFKSSKGKYVAPAAIEDALLADPAVEACCVAGASLPQPLAVVLLQPEAAARAADATGRREIEAAMQARLDTVNAALEPHERLACLVLTTTPWTVESGMITPTMKVRRDRIEARFGARYADWVEQGRRVVWDGLDSPA
jgi:long-chain acyl-CoA synthetase